MMKVSSKYCSENYIQNFQQISYRICIHNKYFTNKNTQFICHDRKKIKLLTKLINKLWNFIHKNTQFMSDNQKEDVDLKKMQKNKLITNNV
jgi:hypothetical protein